MQDERWGDHAAAAAGARGGGWVDDVDPTVPGFSFHISAITSLMLRIVSLKNLIYNVLLIAYFQVGVILL